VCGEWHDDEQGEGVDMLLIIRSACNVLPKVGNYHEFFSDNVVVAGNINMALGV
jgi:hypothetical protein